MVFGEDVRGTHLTLLNPDCFYACFLKGVYIMLRNILWKTVLNQQIWGYVDVGSTFLTFTLCTDILKALRNPAVKKKTI
jgi:hypothetical protein